MNLNRPKHLNLLTIRLPLPGIVSILHRISGFGLFLLIPILLWMLDGSLRSVESFNQIREFLAHPIARLLVLGIVWAVLHHFFAGLRFLALDVHWGSELATTRLVSKLVLLASLSLTILAGVWLW
jgi:succinate dehydrogenase / fumarate reductase cytochrome b subunit